MPWEPYSFPFTPSPVKAFSLTLITLSYKNVEFFVCTQTHTCNIRYLIEDQEYKIGEYSHKKDYKYTLTCTSPKNTRQRKKKKNKKLQNTDGISPGKIKYTGLAMKCGKASCLYSISRSVIAVHSVKDPQKISVESLFYHTISLLDSTIYPAACSYKS